MSRAEMPRVYELCDLIADKVNPSSYFQDFDRSVASAAEKKRVWLAREREFQRLDDAAWQFLKDEALLYLSARDSKGRGWEQLISVLNQARGYNYLVDRGCSDVRFVKRAKEQNRKTPDLEAELDGARIVCEVKTLNASQVEIERRQSGGVGLGADVLSMSFFKKLNRTVQEAERQMLAYAGTAAEHTVFFIVNFDDWLGEYKADYFRQIDDHIGSFHPTGSPKLVFYNQKTAFHRSLFMRHAEIVQRAELSEPSVGSGEGHLRRHGLPAPLPAAKVRSGSGPNTCHLRRTRPTDASVGFPPGLAYRVSINRTTASNSHALPKPINHIRLSHARVGNRDTCIFRKSSSSSRMAKSSRAWLACRSVRRCSGSLARVGHSARTAGWRATIPSALSVNTLYRVRRCTLTLPTKRPSRSSIFDRDDRERSLSAVTTHPDLRGILAKFGPIAPSPPPPTLEERDPDRRPRGRSRRR
jgi:hypothetical protein